MDIKCQKCSGSNRFEKYIEDCFANVNFKQLTRSDCGVSIMVTTLRILGKDFKVSGVYEFFGENMGYIVDMAFFL